MARNIKQIRFAVLDLPDVGAVRIFRTVNGNWQYYKTYIINRNCPSSFRLARILEKYWLKDFLMFEPKYIFVISRLYRCSCYAVEIKQQEN